MGDLPFLQQLGIIGWTALVVGGDAEPGLSRLRVGAPGVPALAWADGANRGNWYYGSKPLNASSLCNETVVVHSTDTAIMHSTDAVAAALSKAGHAAAVHAAWQPHGDGRVGYVSKRRFTTVDDGASLEWTVPQWEEAWIRLIVAMVVNNTRVAGGQISETPLVPVTAPASCSYGAYSAGYEAIGGPAAHFKIDGVVVGGTSSSAVGMRILEVDRLRRMPLRHKAVLS